MKNHINKNKWFMPYYKLTSLNIDKQQTIIKYTNINIKNIKDISFSKLKKFIKNLYILCKLHYISLENRKIRDKHPEKRHPIQPLRGEIYNALITENIGSEICDNHLVVIISNPHTNIFAEKINVLPIEGDGNKVPSYLVKLSNEDLEYGKLDKNPSRIIIPEIITIDKARLGLKIGLIKKEKMLEINKKIIKQLSLKVVDKQ